MFGRGKNWNIGTKIFKRVALVWTIKGEVHRKLPAEVFSVYIDVAKKLPHSWPSPLVFSIQIFFVPGVSSPARVFSKYHGHYFGNKQATDDFIYVLSTKKKEFFASTGQPAWITSLLTHTFQSIFPILRRNQVKHCVQWSIQSGTFCGVKGRSGSGSIIP